MIMMIILFSYMLMIGYVFHYVDIKLKIKLVSKHEMISFMVGF